ncbi:hypothetical protein [Pelosinus propionicus]|uniref:Uncharacterized protein n=1 Tax=Pelosinus propionicus DSM 13327 TaxID=1123291 RepID=A0A1I4JUA6_9FIRM|nr:hypothetical protein [Pelosinus propionicus]SFL70110.1 hypothetical protein SAMN04490355_101426 [Pelosinus propionicus DSM 13327]
MAIEHLVDKYKDELPGYKISGYIELCAPVFKCSLHCLMQSRGQLPVVVEFVLHYYSLGLSLDKISLIIGLDEELVDQAFWELVYQEFINDRTQRITQIGHDYLQERRMDKKEQILVPVCIDGLIGTVKRESSQLMKSRQVRENGLVSLRPVISPPNVDSVEFQQVKRVINEYKKIDAELYDGDLIDLVNVEGNKTFFKRLNVLFYTNDEKNTRIAVYEGLVRVEGYEDALNVLENNDNVILKGLPAHYPQSNLISGLDLSEEYCGPGIIYDNWISLIKSANSKITLSLPLIDICSPSDILIESLIAALKKEVHVTVLSSGREFCSKHQKEQYIKLFELTKKYKSLHLVQIPLWGNKVLTIDDNSGVISDFCRTTIHLQSSQEGYVEYGYLLNKENIEKCHSILNQNTKKSEVLQAKIVDKKWLALKMLTIKELINGVDERLKDINGKGWLGDSVIPNSIALLSVPLAYNEDSFKTFITATNISITESIETVEKGYFWNSFKAICPPGIFHVLEKVRMYRNFCNHIEIETKYKSKFYQFLDEDLAGCLPHFINNGFLYLQIKLLENLEVELRNYLK